MNSYRMKEWYATWFDSPYYHLLYKHRNDREAADFLDGIVGLLKPAKGARVLDLACGKGRHAKCMGDKGFDVVGIDLSAQNIKLASQHSHDRLAFYVHDMREDFRQDHFDLVLNLFTSFGYFGSNQENLVSVRAAANNLKPGGFLVLDYMNVECVRRNLGGVEKTSEEGVSFTVERRIDEHFVVKRIDVADGDQKLTFEEMVRTFVLEDFKAFFEATGLELVNTYGNYDLTPFDEATTQRLIMIAQKEQ